MSTASRNMTDLNGASTSKRILLAVLPTPVAEAAKVVKRIYLLLVNYAYDFWRYAKFSSAVFRGNSEEKLRALITIHYHSLEKGMSLPNPRPGFGVNAVNTLLAHIRWYMADHGPAEHLRVPISVLKRYIEFNEARGVSKAELTEEVKRFEDSYRQKIGQMPQEGGIIDVLRGDIETAIEHVSEDFFNKRYSIRQFSEKNVDIELIKIAVRLAQKSPAVCNRQSGKAWVIDGAANVRLALDIQKGARGFSEGVNKVIIVTSDQCNFQSAGERYQSWIDGGLFAMSLIYALHSLGLGSCCLNWSMEYQRDLELRRAFKIPQTETIIMLLAVGHLPESFSVAASVRKPLDEAFQLVSDINVN